MARAKVIADGPIGFWSGETLEARLGTLITPFDPKRIDGASYTLAMGREVYVSPTDQAADPQTQTLRQLNNGEGFTIPPGQFGFLLSDEIVEVPGHAMALISIKAKIKWRGLINVSGFHVDPGFKGRLVFSVYNAGPVPVHLRQGQAMFLIWYAGLDRPTRMLRDKPIQEHFPDDLIPGISGELQSLEGLNSKIKAVEKELGDRIHDVRREQIYYRLLAVILTLIIGAIITNWVRDGGLQQLLAPPRPSTQTAGTSAPMTTPAPRVSAPMRETPGAADQNSGSASR